MVIGIERGSIGETNTWKGDTDVDGSLIVDGNAAVGGTLQVTGATTFTGTTTFNGSAVVNGSTVLKRKEVSFTAAALTAAGTTATTTGFTIPAGSTVHNCYFLLGTKDTGTLTVSIGTVTTAYENFFKALNIGSSATEGLLTGYPTITTSGTNINQMYNDDCKVGVSLCTFWPGVDGADKTKTQGFFTKKPAYFATATAREVFFKLSGTSATAVGSIIIEYV